MKTVIFDLDGTLLDTLTDLAGAVNHALKECGYPLRTKDEVRRFVGNGVIMLMTRATPDGIAKDDFDKCFNIFRSYYLEHMTDFTKPYDGIIELLDRLKQDGIKTAVVSNKLHDGVVGLCKDFFGDRLTCAYGVADESERKPAPKNVFRAMNELDAIPSDTIYVGDSEVDIQTASNAGLPCIGVSWGFRGKEKLIRGGCACVADNTQELYAMLK